MRGFLVFLFSLCVPFCSGFASDQSYDGRITISVGQLPKFSDYRVPIEKIGEKPSIQFPDNVEVKDSRAFWEKKIAAGPDFAGKYVVLSRGCGSPCQVNWIVNLKTGKTVGSIGSSWGVTYKLDSRLIISNFRSGNLVYDRKEEVGMTDVVTFYELKDDKIIEIQSIRPLGLFPEYFTGGPR